MPQVTIYTTNSCPYCVMAKKFLQKHEIKNINEIRIDEQPEQREVMMKKTGRRTVPQIYVDDVHVGGYDDLVAMDKKGELEPLLRKKP